MITPRAATQPSVSVVIPTFNRRRLVIEAIESVRAQSLRTFELLVVDDGSTDGTADALRARYADDARVRVVEQANGGTARARNRGLDEVSAPWTAFLDSDDLWKPDYLETQLAAVTAQGVDAVLSDADYDGMDRSESLFEDPIFRAPTSFEAMQEGAWGLPSALVVRSAVARALRFDPSFEYSEDTEFLVRFHEAGHRLVLNPGRVAIWRDHAQQRKNHDIGFGHQLAQIRMMRPYWGHGRVRRRVRELLYVMHREAAKDLVRDGFWYEARPHLARCFRHRPHRARTALRLVRSLLARPTERPLPDRARRRTEELATLRGIPSAQKATER